MAVNLVHEPRIAPEEVHEVSAEPDVDLRMWEPGLPDEREEALLGLRAGQAGTHLPVE